MYIETLIKIKNAIMAGKDTVKVPYSKADLAILEKMCQVGYLKSAQRKGRGIKKIIAIELQHGEKEKPVINDIRFVSCHSQKIYRGYQELRRSKQGYGHYFLSTSQGIMTEVEAKKKKLGGKVLFEVW